MRGYDIDKYINHKFNKLTLIKNLNKIDKHNSKLALFKCDCGNIKEMVFTQVLSGETKTCGCEQGNLSKEAQIRRYNSSLEFYKNKTLKNNKSGYTGISKVGNKYRVRIQKDKKSIQIGYYDDIEQAIKARKDAEKKYFKPILEKYKKGDN